MLRRLFKSIPKVATTSHPLPVRPFNHISKKWNSTLHLPDKELSNPTSQHLPNNVPSFAAQELELFDAINRGNPRAKIWKDTNCYFYLFNLITQNKIRFWHGMSAYAYLTATMQFPEKTKVNVLSKKNKLTPEGSNFLKVIYNRLKIAGYPISYSNLEKFILTMPPIEQWLIKLPWVDFNLYKNLPQADHFLSILVANIPFVSYETNLDGFGHCWIPSSSIIHYLLKKISDHPIQMMPTFDAINFETLKSMHANNKHPIFLCPYQANESFPLDHGGFLGWLTGIGYTFWGSMLTTEERKILFVDIIPILESILNIATHHQDIQLTAIVQQTIEKAISFNLTDIRNFTHYYRFMYYVSRIFSINNDRSFYPANYYVFDRIGAPAEDRFYFLLLRMQHTLEPGDKKDFWNTLIQSIRPHDDSYRDQMAMNAIEKLAQFAANLPVETASSLELNKEDCQAWLKIIDSSKSSEEVWKTIFEEDKSKQFLYLISDGHLLFFHPYLPLSDDMRKLFKQTLEIKLYQLEKQNSATTFSAAKSPLQANHLLAHGVIPPSDPRCHPRESAVIPAKAGTHSANTIKR